ncbi:unnamed protein product, partial [Callosobruchus maculatus]
HCLCPEYSARFGLTGEDPRCSCGEAGSIQHCILECRQANDDITELYNQMARFVCLLTNLSQILSNENCDMYKILYYHCVHKLKLVIYVLPTEKL